MSQIKQRLGLDWIRKQRPIESSSRGFESKASEDFLEEALLAYGPRVMEFMAQARDRTTTVFEIVDHLGEPVSVLGPVLENLRDRGYVDVVKEDLKGDHTVRLTDRGLKVVS